MLPLRDGIDDLSVYHGLGHSEVVPRVLADEEFGPLWAADRSGHPVVNRNLEHTAQHHECHKWRHHGAILDGHDTDTAVRVGVPLPDSLNRKPSVRFEWPRRNV